MRLLLIIAVFLFNLQAKSLFSNDEQKQSSHFIGSLKELLISTQKTRGLTNSYLNGNTATLLLVYGNRDDMKRAIGKMESTTLAADPVINARMQNISNALLKLNHRALKQKAKKTFSEYTEEIQEILMFAQTVSQRSSKDLTPFGKESSQIMIMTLLPLTEAIGQLRGFGSGLASKKTLSKSDIEQIYLLVHQATTLDETLQEQMSGLSSKYSSKLPSSIHTELSSVEKKIQAYSSLASKKLIKTPKDIDPDIFFEEGTSIISAIIKLYNSTNYAVLEDAKGWL